MKCKKCKELIHLVVDGELNPEQEASVRAHLKECAACRAYYKDMAVLSTSLQQVDQEPSDEFRAKWKQMIARAAQPKKKYRPSVLVPAVACGAAAVFVVSTALVNPQALGLSGQNVTSQWFDIDKPAVTEPEEQPTQGVGPGVDVQFFGKKEKKESLLDFESSDYSETITSASAEPELSFSGEIVSQTSAEPSAESRVGSPGDGSYVWNESAYEIDVTEISSIETLLSRSHDFADVFLTEWDAAFILEGPDDKVRELLEEFHVSVPEGTSMVRILKSE